MAKAVRIKVAPTTGTPTIPNKGDFDIRDRLAELVGKGNALAPDDKAAIYGSLVASLGKDKAEKVMSHAYLFNNRPDIVKLPSEDKIRAFYTIGSNDPDVNAIISKSKTLEYGPIAGFRQSASSINQGLSGQAPLLTTAPGATVSPEVQRKIMVRVNK